MYPKNKITWRSLMLIVVVAHTAKLRSISTTSAVVYLRREMKRAESVYSSMETIGVDEATRLQIYRQTFAK
jgi:hypothetical protein